MLPVLALWMLDADGVIADSSVNICFVNGLCTVLLTFVIALVIKNETRHISGY